jgi:hypothetical protein
MRREHRRVASSIALALAGVTTVGTGSADATKTDETAKTEATPAAAEELFLKGREAMKTGDYPHACLYFEESQALDPAPGTLLNLGLCEEQLGKVASSWKHAKGVLSAIDADDNRRPLAEQLVARVSLRLPRLRIELASSLAVAAVMLDGIPVPKEDVGPFVAVDPGEHVVEARLGARAVTAKVTIAEKEERVVLLAEEAPPAIAATKAKAKTDANAFTNVAHIHPYRSAGIIVGSVGVAAFALGAVGIYGALDAKHDADAICPSTPCDAADAQHEANDRGRRWNFVATTSFVVGAAALGVGTYLFLAEADPAAPRVGLAFDGKGLAFSLRGGF